MPTIGQLVINLLGNAKPFTDEVKKAKADVGSLASSIAATVAVTAGLAAVTKTVSLGAEFESTEMAFKTLLKDADLAKKTLGELSAFAAATPFQLPEVEQGAKQLLGYQFAADQLVPTLRMLGDVGAGLKIPLSDLVYLYGTSSQQAHLYTRDINQFASRGIPIIAALSQVLGVAKSDISGMVEAGQVNFSHLKAALESLTGAGGQFENVMANASSTLEGRYSNLQDNITLTMREIGLEIIKAFDLKGVLEGLITGTAMIRSTISEYGGEILAVTAITAGFTAGMYIARAAMAAYNVITKLCTASSITFQAITNPAFILQLAAGLLVAAFAMEQVDGAYQKAAQDAGAYASATDAASAANAGLSASAKGAKADISQLPTELEKQLRIIKEINKQNPNGDLTPNVQRKKDTAIGAIGSLIDIGGKSSVGKETDQVKALWQAYDLVRTAQDRVSDHQFRLDGISSEIERLTGVTKELEKIQEEIDTVRQGADAVKLKALSDAGASPDQIDKVKAGQKELADAKAQKKEYEDSQAAAKKLVEETLTPIEKLHGELERLAKLKEGGFIDDQTFNRGVAKAGEEFDKDGKPKNKSKEVVISALQQGSQDAQNVIAKAMSAGGKNPNEKLENETKRNGKTLEIVAKHLATIAGKKPQDGVTIVENI